MNKRISLEYILGGLILIVFGLTLFLSHLGILAKENWWAYLSTGIGFAFFVDAILRAIILKKGYKAKIVFGIILSVIGLNKVFGLRNWLSIGALILGLILIVIGLVQLFKSEKKDVL